VIIDRLAGAVNAAAAPFRKRVITISVPSLTRGADRRGNDEHRQRHHQRAPAAEEVGSAPA
jgi:hypothetical protein